MAAPLRMARAALLFVVIVIAMNPGAHGFATSEGGSAVAELKALSAQVSRLEGDIASISTMVLALSTKPLEAPIGHSSLGNGLIPGTDRRQLQTDEPSDGGDGSCGILCLPPNLVGGMQDLQLILPLDWECQTGTAGGVYPCPEGRPSTCSLDRYKHKLGTGKEEALSESCAACFCLENTHTCCEHIDTDNCKQADACGGGDLEGWKDNAGDDCSSFQRNPNWCTEYPDAKDPLTNITVKTACQVCRSGNQACHGKDYDLPGWNDTSGDDCNSFRKSPSWCDTYSTSADPSTDILVGEACAVCRPKRVFGSCSSKFTESAWSTPWWEDKAAGRSYVNFKITRYEMSPDFGVEFYSTEGDTVRIFPDGEVHFKPNNAKRSLVVNEQVRYAMGGGEPARGRVLSTGLPKKTSAAPDLSLPLSDTQIQQLRADLRSSQERGPYDQRNTRASKRRRRIRGGGFLSTQGSMSLSGGTAAGSD